MIPVLREKHEALAALCLSYGVRRLEVFGSAATNDRFDPERSDLDFIVDFAPGQDMGPWLKHYFDFKAALEGLFQRRVDLVMGSALKNPLLLREVSRTRATLYAA
jgi:predicted nucleotidyltransferase